VKLLGLLVCLLGWLIAINSVQLSSTAAQLFVALLGFVVSGFGAMGILNGAHLKNAIWKA
jgi:uncharacterized membrane protein